MKKIGKDKTKRISKFLSMILRHKPETIGLTLDKQGWADVDTLLEKARKRGKHISRDLLNQVVETNDKKRFAFSEDGKSIRASQGHSIEIDLAYEESIPPDILYHGTYQPVIDAIFKDGLKKMQRHHVHLSVETKTAEKVGSRHGKVVILSVDTKAMHEEGHLFYVSANGVWLTEVVPPKFLTKVS